MAYKFEKYSIGGGGSGGGGAELNIAYGDTAPEDTTKLWVKTTEPSKVVVSSDVKVKHVSNEVFEVLEPTFPNAKYKPVAEAVGDKIYIFGGMLNNKSVYYNETHRFDPKTNTLVDLGISANAVGTASAVVGTDIYLLTGSANAAIRRFDTTTETLTTLSTSFSSWIANSVAGAVGTKIYVFGGQNKNIVNCFDTETETLTTLATTMPTNNNSMGCGVIGNKIYLLGGYISSYATPHNTCYCFDTETETFTYVSRTLPKPCTNSGCATIGTEIYLIGGLGNYRGIQRFDAETGEIEELSISLPQNIAYTGCAAVGSDIYTFCGALSQADTTCLDIIGHFQPATKVAMVEDGVLQIVPKAGKNTFNLTDTDTVKTVVGVDKVYKGNANNEGEQVEAALYQDGAWTTI